ncbi:hypothetical protein MTO96_040575 [Rhipicephalus appendiculatus]
MGDPPHMQSATSAPLQDTFQRDSWDRRPPVTNENAVQCGAELLEDATALYGFGSQGVPAVRAIAKCRADLIIDNVVGKNIPTLVVPDEAQSVDLIVGRTFTELPYVTYARLGGSLHFWHRDECPFSHLEPHVSCPKVRLNTDEETTPQANVVNWVSPQSNVADPVLFNNCGREIVVVMEGKELTVPVFTSREDAVLRKGHRLGHVTKMDISGCEKIGEINSREKCGAVESEQIMLAEAQRPNMREEMRVGPSVTEMQRRKLAHLLYENRDCFANNLSELGCTQIISMDVQENHGSTPVTVRPYRTNAAEREAMRDIAGEWEKAGIGAKMFSS